MNAPLARYQLHRLRNLPQGFFFAGTTPFAGAGAATLAGGGEADAAAALALAGGAEAGGGALAITGAALSGSAGCGFISGGAAAGSRWAGVGSAGGATAGAAGGGSGNSTPLVDESAKTALPATTMAVAIPAIHGARELGGGRWSSKL